MTIICMAFINLNALTQPGELFSFAWRIWGPDPDQYGKLAYWSAKITWLCPKCASGFWVLVYFASQGQFSQAFIYSQIAIFLNLIYGKAFNE